jgi:hypothetical protein
MTLQEEEKKKKHRVQIKICTGVPLKYALMPYYAFEIPRCEFHLYFHTYLSFIQTNTYKRHGNSTPQYSSHADF